MPRHLPWDFQFHPCQVAHPVLGLIGIQLSVHVWHVWWTLRPFEARLIKDFFRNWHALPGIPRGEVEVGLLAIQGVNRTRAKGKKREQDWKLKKVESARFAAQQHIGTLQWPFLGLTV